MPHEPQPAAGEGALALRFADLFERFVARVLMTSG